MMEEKRRVFDNLISKFIFSDDLKRNVSALTSLDAETGEDDSVDERQCQPWERNALLKRLRTFRCVWRLPHLSHVAHCMQYRTLPTLTASSSWALIPLRGVQQVCATVDMGPAQSCRRD